MRHCEERHDVTCTLNSLWSVVSGLDPKLWGCFQGGAWMTMSKSINLLSCLHPSSINALEIGWTTTLAILLPSSIFDFPSQVVCKSSNTTCYGYLLLPVIYETDIISYSDKDISHWCWWLVKDGWCLMSIINVLTERMDLETKIRQILKIGLKGPIQCLI